MLKWTYAKKEDIPKGAEEFYKEVNGQWVLQADGVSNETAEGYRSSMNAARADADKLKGVLKGFGKHTPESIAKLEEQAAGSGTNEDVEARANAIVEVRTKNLQRDITAANQRADKAEGELAKVNGEFTKQQIETAAINAAASMPQVAESAMVDVRMHAAADLELNEQGKVVTRETCELGAGLSVKDWLEKKLEKLPHWETPSVGGGSQGGPRKRPTIKNPWNKDTWNVTEQHKLMQSDFAKAEQLAKAEGHILNQPV